MDDQEISLIFADRLNPVLYNLQVYEHECLYAPRLRVADQTHSLMVDMSAPSPNESNTSYAAPSATQVAVITKVASKPTPALNSIGDCPPIKGNMSNSSETQPDNFEMRARTDPNQMETSRAGESNQLAVPASLPSDNPTDPVVLMLADVTYQGIMDSLPTLIRNSLPATLTNKNLDRFATYFSIPANIVETRLASPDDQVILPHIDIGTSDPNFTPGYTVVYAEAFSYGMHLPFSNFVNNLLITINRAPG
ncbi:hypothetical protein LIER_36780 [Lithospermum erythrorhizon]|uniref:Uncharacterized protein n=1 Tax=Lithospermum erythrorhizon TaxID=34254 RepID=A0AAV3PFA3_LITER